MININFKKQNFTFRNDPKNDKKLVIFILGFKKTLFYPSLKIL